MDMTAGPARPADRLAFFLPGLYGGGAERVMLNLARGITERGFQVDLVLGRAEGSFLEEIPPAVRLIDLKAPRVLLGTPALTRYLRNERPKALLSVLHANMVALWGSRLAGVPVRVILAEHNTLSSVSHGMRDIRWRLYPLPARLFYPWADRIVAVSKGVADDLAETIQLPRERIEVIYNPIVTADMFTKATEVIEHPWFRSGEPPVLLAVGRLTRQKAFDLLIRAFARVRKNQAARLLILGEGEERPTLEAMVKEFGLDESVSLPGFLPNPYAFMAHAAAFVLSSRWEGLPTVLVEAMALGVPIISTDCPSGPREILLDGRYGCLIPMEDPAALSAAIETALGSTPLRPPVESWAPFRLEHVVDQYLNVLLGNQPCAN